MNLDNRNRREEIDAYTGSLLIIIFILAVCVMLMTLVPVHQ